MKSALVGLALFASAFAPALALAKGIEDVSYNADANDVVVTVHSDEALAAPTVRTMAGSVRVRFYDAKNVSGLHVPGDGGAVRGVDLTRGSDQSAALMIVLGDQTHIAPSDVRVERSADKVQFKIARGLLPALNAEGLSAHGAGKPRAIAPAVAPNAAPSATLPAAPKPAAALPAPVAVAAPVVKSGASAPATTPAVAQAAPAAPSPAAAAPAAPPAADVASKPAFALGAKRSANDSDAQKLKLASGQSSAMPMLLAITVLLAASYAGLRLFLRKKSLSSPVPAIDVIAQRRLGPRHQLVIVRAFDRDYLLSIQGGHTTVVARSSRRKVDAVDAGEQAELDELVAPRRQDIEARALDREQNGEGALSLFTSARQMPPPLKGAFEEEDDEATFGGELFKQALEQRERAREQTASFRLEAARAEARAELARTGKGEPANANASPATPTNGSGALEGAAGMSDSVSGLLRLRREAGRQS